LKNKLIHPLWTHLPAILLILVAVGFTLKIWPLPENAPTHFDFNGQPNGYGSPLASSILLLALSIGLLALSVWLDELWARQEKAKTFNWLSLFDEFAIGDLCGVQIAYTAMLASSSSVFLFPWREVTVACLAAVGLAVVLELLRPYRHYEKVYQAEAAGNLEEEVRELVRSGGHFSYREMQNPAYINILAALLPVVMFIAAVFTWQQLPWLSILLALIGAGFFLIYGGFRTLVTRDAITLKMGVLGIRLLRIDTSDITSIEVHNFSPLRDFGGYGIRINREMTAYFLQGDRGVKLTKRAAKTYLIGSDHPERLAAVIKAIV